MFHTPAHKQPATQPVINVSELRAAFHFLQRNGMNPTWVGGQYVIANVPGIRLGTNGSPNTVIHTPEVVRSLRQAIVLVESCK